MTSLDNAPQLPRAAVSADEIPLSIVLQKQAHIWDQICAHEDVLEQKEKHLQSAIAELKRLQDLHPDIVAFLEKFQEHTHRKAVGVYEELLSAIVNEVLPPGDRKIVLALSTERGLPALEVASIKGKGQEESILDGSGGSLVNVISAGLRIIALARSQNTPFLLLDEADCWLKESRVERFGTVIGQVAQDIGVQVFMISHKDPHYFDKYSTLVKLVYNPKQKKLESVLLSEPADGLGLVKVEPAKHFSLAEKKIAQIQLENFMSHENTIIPLGQTVTCFIGENDLGKSAVASALRSVFYADSSDSFVRHGQKSCKVSLLLNSGEKIVFEHFLKKSPKRVWSLFVGNGTMPLMDAFPKYGAPDWLETIFCVKKFEGLDVQLANQKSPVFLLDEPASKRASILSIGGEAHTLQKMIALHKENNQGNNALLKTQEQELGRVVRQRNVLKEYAYLGAELSDLQAEEKKLEAGAQAVERLSATLEQYALVLQRASVALSEGVSAMELPWRTQDLDTRLVQWKRYQACLASVEVPIDVSRLHLILLEKKWSNLRSLQSRKEAMMAIESISDLDKVTDELKNNTKLTQEGLSLLTFKKSLIRLRKQISLGSLDLPTAPKEEVSVTFNVQEYWYKLYRMEQLQKGLKIIFPMKMIGETLRPFVFKYELGTFFAQSKRFAYLQDFTQRFASFSKTDCPSVSYKDTLHLKGLLRLRNALTETEGKIKKASESYALKKIKLEEGLMQVHALLGGVCPLCAQGFKVTKIKDLQV